MVPSSMPMRGPPGQGGGGGGGGPRTGTSMRAPMGRGDYGKRAFSLHLSFPRGVLILFVTFINKQREPWSVSLFGQVTILSRRISPILIVSRAYVSRMFSPPSMAAHT